MITHVIDFDNANLFYSGERLFASPFSRFFAEIPVLHLAIQRRAADSAGSGQPALLGSVVAGSRVWHRGIRCAQRGRRDGDWCGQRYRAVPVSTALSSTSMHATICIRHCSINAGISSSAMPTVLMGGSARICNRPLCQRFSRMVRL